MRTFRKQFVMWTLVLAATGAPLGAMPAQQAARSLFAQAQRPPAGLA